MEFENDLREHVFGLSPDEAGVAQHLVNNAVYAGRKLSTDSRVPGRIGREEFFEFWRDELNASDFVLGTIKHGYQFPFIEEPPRSFCKNNKSFFDHRDFAYTELLRLESLGCIRRVTEQPYITLPISVVFSKKLRLVVDGSRHLNPFLQDRKIKLEGLDVNEQIILQGDYQTTADLDSGYWHVPLHEQFKKYVGVHYVLDSGEVLYWEWNVLFLGIKDAAWIFTKILIPHKQYCRKNGIRMQIYMDDQKVFGNSYEKCLRDTEFANTALRKAGWLVNPDKCSSEPVQCIKFLGLMNDANLMMYFVPEDKVITICDLITDILKMKRVHIKILAKLVGKVQFCYKAMGPTVKLLCRSSFHLISKAKTWYSMLELNDLAKKELLYLKENFVLLNGHPIRPFLSTEVIDVKLSSDASDLGFCVYRVCDNNDVLLKQVFSPADARLSSTHRELIAFHRYYLSGQAEILRGKNVVHYTDNANCEVILTVGSRNVTLQPLVLDIFLCWKNLNIKVKVIHLSRNDPIIQYADLESRNFDLHDYSIDFDNFLVLCNLFGVFEVDCFASFVNKKCIRYFSKFYEEFAEGQNFFAQRLPLCNLLVFPPVHLIIPTLYHLQKFKAFGCLLIPQWTSSYFWTFICEDGRHFNNFIKFVFCFSPIFSCGEFVKNDMFRGVKKFDTLALRFDFSISNAFTSNVDKEFCIFKGCTRCFS
jgi:hypothetical protein